MEDETFTLRDQLAFDRTRMANERTILAYLRTFIGMEGAGAALIKLFNDVPQTKVAAYLLFGIAPFALIFGVYRYISVELKLKAYTPDKL